MGANSNPNAARLVTLQERKQSIEETLVKRNQELRQLCIQVKFVSPHQFLLYIIIEFRYFRKPS